MKEGKPFEISKHQVMEAYRRVKAKHGGGGTDGVDFTEFEKDLKNNLYKIWNRMSSGCYFPAAVRGVEIPKKNGKKRLLGIPTIEDRVAQMVVRMSFESIVEPIFCQTHLDIDPIGQQSTLLVSPEKDAGKCRGFWSSTLWVCLIISVSYTHLRAHE